MLSGEGNAGERWKTTIGLISKKATLLVQKCSTLFLYISLPLFWTTSMWNFQKLLCYTLFGGNVVRVFVHLFFSLPLIFTLDIVRHLHFSFCHRRYKVFMLFFQQKEMSPLFFFFSRWAWLACRLLSLFLCLSLALYSKFVDMTINLLSLVL